MTPEEAAFIRSSLGAKEQAPSSRVQSVFENWREVADILGDPFETERIPLSKLRQMRRDPMLGFGMSFTKTPHVSAKWYMNAKDNKGPNAQIAAHADHDMRRIFASFVLQYLNCLDFGFQAIAKRFEFRIPSGNFIEISDAGEQTEKPIWSQGGIQPIAWKPGVALRPEGVQPVWDKSTGEFFGIEYTPTGAATGGAGGSGGVPSGVGASKTGGGKGGTNKEETYKIDLPHSLWVTNEKDSNFGSIFGYPRLGYAYKYWWSYWFRWAIADRSFERKADPSVIIYHPDGEFLNEETGERMTHSEYALLMGERMRSGGVIALPSEVYEDNNGRGTLRQWEIDFTKEATNFDPFDRSFEYLDVQKLRSLFIPEQAFLEGKGGTSSRNVAAEMGQSFIESQKVLSAQIVDTINRFMMPQWLAVNYPEFMANGGTVEIVVQGFGDEDTAFMTQLIQLIGQQESGAREIAKLADIQKLLEDRGTPIVSFAEQQRRDAQIVAEQQAAAAPAGPVAPVPGQQVGVVPSTTGFSYIQPREIIHLADTGTDFIENLPASPHYEDKAIRGFARQIWWLYRDLFRDEYDLAAAAIGAEEGEVTLSDDPVEAADTVKNLLAEWKRSPKWNDVIGRTLAVMESVMKRASRITLARTKKSDARVDQDAITSFLQEHYAAVSASVAETTGREVNHYVATLVQNGVTDRAELAAKVRQHFSDFPQWKADRLARTEIRDIYNAATLLAAQAAGYDRVQAMDGLLSNVSDDDCGERNGRIFSIDAAFKEREHPNGTLAWRFVPTTFSVERRPDAEAIEFDDESQRLTLTQGASDESAQKIMLQCIDHLYATGKV